MKINIVVGKTHSHIFKNATCNGNNYRVPFPSSNHNFINITDKIQISKDYQLCLAVLSKTQASVNSIQEFYKVQDIGIQYFNLPIEINSLQFVLDILDNSNIPAEEMDKLTFSDLLLILKLGHDCIAKKMHSKLNRRIKKYLSESKRQQHQVDHIKRLMAHMKNESTDQQVNNVGDVPQRKKAAKKSLDPQRQKIQKKRVKDNEEEFLTEKPSEPEGQPKHKKTKVPKVKVEEQADNDWQDLPAEKPRLIESKQPKRETANRVIDVGHENIINLESDDEGSPDVHKPKRRHKKQKAVGKPFAYYKERPQKDQKIMLGITGDTEEGWRERYRVRKAPSDNPINKLLGAPEKQGPILASEI